MLNSAFAVAFRVSIGVELPSGCTRSTTPFFWYKPDALTRTTCGYQPVAETIDLVAALEDFFIHAHSSRVEGLAWVMPLSVSTPVNSNVSAPSLISLMS